MQWDDSANAGFTTGEPWLKVNDNYHEINVEKEENDPSSALNYYRQLKQLRDKHQALIDGKFRSFEDDNNDVYIYERYNKDETIRVLVNFKDYEVNIDPIYEENTKVLICSCPQHDKGILKPWEALILQVDMC